jgi:hypothetical protein
VGCARVMMTCCACCAMAAERTSSARPAINVAFLKPASCVTGCNWSRDGTYHSRQHLPAHPSQHSAPSRRRQRERSFSPWTGLESLFRSKRQTEPCFRRVSPTAEASAAAARTPRCSLGKKRSDLCGSGCRQENRKCCCRPATRAIRTFQEPSCCLRPKTAERRMIL